MALYNFHRVLIAASILFFFGLGLWSFKHESSGNVGMGIGALVVSLSMVSYLIYFNCRMRVFSGQPKGPLPR